MDTQTILVNGTRVPLLRAIFNPLLPDACKARGLNFVENVIVHTNLHVLDIPIVDSSTYGLTFYAPAIIDMDGPNIMRAGVRYRTEDRHSTIVETFSYNDETYGLVDPKFYLNGDIGCSAAANLGFFLLRKFWGISAPQIGILSLYDKLQLDETEELDIPVCDEPVETFLRAHDSWIV